MHILKPSWLRHSGKRNIYYLGCIIVLGSFRSLLIRIARAGEQKDFEVYSCHVSPDGSRLATAGGGMSMRLNVYNNRQLTPLGQMATSESGRPRPSTTPMTRTTANHDSSAT
jgi:hypothetical protein